MYKKTLLLLLFVFSCFLISCRVTRQETQKTETQVQVTSEKEIKFKDTTVFAPKSETSLKIPVSELVFKDDLKAISKPKFYTQKNGNATAKIKIIHDTITVTATCDSLAIVAKIKSELIKQTNNSKTSDSNLTKQKSGFSFWDLIIAFVLGIVVCYILKLLKILP